MKDLTSTIKGHISLLLEGVVLLAEVPQLHKIQVFTRWPIIVSTWFPGGKRSDELLFLHKFYQEFIIITNNNTLVTAWNRWWRTHFFYVNQNCAQGIIIIIISYLYIAKSLHNSLQSKGRRSKLQYNFLN